MKLLELKNNKEFINIISKRKLVVVYFYSENCEKITKKINDFLENIYNLNILFYSVNVYKSDSIVKKSDVTTFPVLHLYKNNEFIKELFCNINNLDEILKKLYE